MQTPQRPIIIAFDEAHLQFVIQALADKPYRESAPVIFAINQQIAARIQREGEAVTGDQQGANDGS